MAKRPGTPEAFFHNLAGRCDPHVDRAIRDLNQQIGTLRQDQVTRADLPKVPTLAEIRKALSSSGENPLTVQNLIGVLGNPQRASVVVNSSGPTTGILAQSGTVTLINGVLSYFDTTTNPGTWKPIGAVATIFQDTHANRIGLAKYSPSTLPIGSVFWETDRTLLYFNQGTFGTSHWQYSLGTYSLSQAGVAGVIGALTAVDTNLLLEVTDYAHILKWNGANLIWGPGERGSGESCLFEVDPTGPGWHLYDGSTATFLKSDGTLGTTGALVNVSGAGPTPAYLKAGPANTGLTAPIAPTFTPGTLTFTGTPATLTGTFTGAALAGHQHQIPVGASATAIAAANTFGTGAALTGITIVTSVASGALFSSMLTQSVTAGTPSGTISMNSYTPAGTISGSGSVGSNGEPESITRRLWFRQ